SDRARSGGHRAAGRARCGGHPDRWGGRLVSAVAATADGHGHDASGHTASAYHDSLLRSPVFLGMVMFIGSEIMLFGSFFTAFFYVRFSHAEYPYDPNHLFEIPKATTG